MSLEKNDFYGKDVSEAIKKACVVLGVPQENLDIEVVETGSTGIFGLIRKKAHIRVQIKPVIAEAAGIFALDSSSPACETKEEEQQVPEIDSVCGGPQS